MTSDYCRKVCGTPCADCPAPRLLPDNLPALAAYRRVVTQWQYAGAGLGGLYRTGLNYSGVMPVLHALAAEWTDWTALELLEQIQLIEETMLEADSERHQETAAP